jgi:GT2 family glycosyltransferase
LPHLIFKLNNIMSKIGVGIITCNRKEFYEKCYNSIPKNIGEIVTVNDSGFPEAYGSGAVIVNPTNEGVGKSKNKALKYLLNAGCEYLFLIEDDIIVKNPNVFDYYINAYKETGIHHFMYGLHGPANKLNSKAHPRLIVEYTNNLKIRFNTHCVGAFCFYTRKCLETSGLMDEKFQNAWEHVEHSYTLAKKGFCPAYWWWPDIDKSEEYLDELACSEVSSTIRGRTDWQDNIQKGMEYFKSKHGHYPVSVPDTQHLEVVEKLKNIKMQHGS